MTLIEAGDTDYVAIDADGNVVFSSVCSDLVYEFVADSLMPYRVIEVPRAKVPHVKLPHAEVPRA